MKYKNAKISELYYSEFELSNLFVPEFTGYPVLFVNIILVIGELIVGQF